MRAALYFRVSTDEQKERASIETQREFAAQYCKVQEITVIASYSDDGISGTIPVAERPGGFRLLSDARAKKFDTILVYKLDRLARSTLEILKAVETLGQWGVSIKSMTEPFETDSSVGKFLVSMLASVAQLERDAIRDRSGAGMERLARHGRWLGGRPSFGYQVVDGKLAIHPEQAEIVKEIFRLFLSGSKQNAIARHLNAQGVIHPTGLDGKGMNRLWREATISKLLRDTVYAGTFRWRKTTARKRLGRRITFIKAPESQQISCSVPAIISVEDFAETQRILKENLRRSLRNARNFYLLRSLSKCGCCGRTYVGLTAGNRRHQYYRCGSHFRRIGVEPCEGKAVRADVLNERVWEHCASFILNPAAVLEEVRQMMLASQMDQNDLNDRIASLDSILTGKLSERPRVINLARRGLINDEEAEHELTRLQQEVNQIQIERDELARGQETAESLELRLLTAETMLKLMVDRVSKVDDKTKREIVLALVDRITIDTVREGNDTRTTARVRYAFDPPPIQRYTQRLNLRYPEILSPVSTVVDYLTCVWPRANATRRPWGYESALGVAQIVTSSHITLSFIRTCRRYRAASVDVLLQGFSSSHVTIA